jgi:dienelactone hydrolase
VSARLFFLLAASALAQTPAEQDRLQALASDPLLRWMDAQAQQLLADREKSVAAITTLPDALRRQELVRRKLLQALGGLPDYRGPLRPRITGRLNAPGYVIEKLYFESLPGLYVTANLYRPAAPGRYPAILFQSGHTQEGKPEPQIAAANLALQGFVVLAHDPLGQGEREQSFHPFYGRAMAGGSVNEHLAIGAQSMLTGHSAARYFIHDAKRAIDYLVSRPDVDPARIGAAGCSGGGALTAWIGALDPRVKAVAVACYISTYKFLFAGRNPDTEMSLPGFLSLGLDMADIVTLAAPKPWLLLATEEDYFTPAAAREVFLEAQRWFALHGVPERVRFFVAPGAHGTPQPTREELYTWMHRWLRAGDGPIRERPVPEFTNLELRVTRTGNVHDEPGARRLHEILHDRLPPRPASVPLLPLRDELKRLGIVPQHRPPIVTPRAERIQFESEPGVPISGRLHLPDSPGPHPAILLVEDVPLPVPLFQRLSPSTVDLARSLQQRGFVVLELSPRDSPSSRTPQPFVGNWLANTRADMIGRNLPAMRAYDILRGVDLLAARPDVDPARIRAIARGVKGVWLLLAAAADPRIQSIWLDRTPASYRSAFHRPLGQFLFDGLLPAFLLRWDLADLKSLIHPRPVFWSDPASWMNDVIPLPGPYRYRYTGEPDEPLLDEFLRR